MPVLLLLGLAAAWMLYYNWRGTGNPLRMAYTINQATYHISKPFLFQKPYPIPNYHNLPMRTFYMFHEYPDLLRVPLRVGTPGTHGAEVFLLLRFLCLASSAPLRSGPDAGRAQPGVARRFLRHSPPARWASPCNSGLPTDTTPPRRGRCSSDSIHCLRQLRNARNSAWLRCFSRAIVLALFLWMLVPISDRLWNPYSLDVFPNSDRASLPREIERARLQSQISRLPGQHLILVHYGASRRTQQGMGL